MKLWGGRFEKETNTMVDAFNACIGFGSRLYEQASWRSMPSARPSCLSLLPTKTAP